MPQREFTNQKALIEYAEQNDLAYEYEYTPAFAKRQRLLSPEQYEIVEVRTSRGVSRGDGVLEGDLGRAVGGRCSASQALGYGCPGDGVEPDHKKFQGCSMMQ
jgi:hypothetical protein